MTTECSRYRAQIPAMMLGDLDDEARDALARHLAECAPCRSERELYGNMFAHLHAADDVPAPRHFFVYPEEPGRSPWRLFRQMSPVLQGAFAFLAVGILLTAFAAAGGLQIRAEAGALTIGFGTLPETRMAAPLPPPIDAPALEAKILGAVQEANRRESLEWIRTLRTEIARSKHVVSSEQRALLQQALAGVEARMSTHISTAASELETRTAKSLAGLYQTVSTERAQDFDILQSRVNRIAVSGEMKSSQTDAILETLLQVAELKIQ